MDKVALDKARHHRYNTKRYWTNVEETRVQLVIRYYKKKLDKGQPWMPKRYSKLDSMCREKGLDVEKVIRGEIKWQQLLDTTIEPA
jgi:hypothetical protein